MNRGQLLSADRSVQAEFSWHAGDVWWGATWACLCGALAALPWAPVDGLVRFAVAWFSAVVLLGTVWAPAGGGSDRRRLSGGAAPPQGPLEHTFLRSLGSWVPPLTRWISAGRGSRRRFGQDGLQRAVAGVGALGLAWLLGFGPAVVVALGLALALSLPVGPSRAGAGVRRTALEIVVPATAAWLALGGPESVPASASVFGGVGESAAWWLAHNWGFLAVLAAFAAIYHACTSVERPADLPGRHRELVLGYGAAVLALAALDKPLAAGVVAALFIAQWPFQAEFRAGRVRWHLNSTQPVSMAAMLVAALGAG